MTKFFRTFMFALIAMSFVLAACAPATTQAPEPTDAPPATEVPATTAPEPTAAPTEAPAEDAMAMYAPDAVSGDIIAAGSSTVFPLAERIPISLNAECGLASFTGHISYAKPCSLSRKMLSSWRGELAEAAGDVVLRALVLWSCENSGSVVEFDHSSKVHERGEIRDTCSLLHVVGDDDDRDHRREFRHQLLDASSGNGIERRSRLVK